MPITGDNFIGYARHSKGGDSFHAFSPGKNVYLPEIFNYATIEELQIAMVLARKAFLPFRDLPAKRRAEFLDAIAAQIMLLGDELIKRGVAESGLPEDRIISERGRTCSQLKMFAQLLRDGWWVDARIDTAQPGRSPLPKPDIRRMLRPIGPVAVFGASNFPLAFSTAGGDTASALAAGCPVIVKAHPSHPGTNELVASAIIIAAQQTDMPEGVFSSLHLTDENSIKLVQHPLIKAVGFTGSRKVGMMLFNTAISRQEPIPVYAEMSAINPVVLMESSLRAKGEEIAKGIAGSVKLGVGQFCTNPGLVLMVESEAALSFLDLLVQQLNVSQPGTMLNKGISKAYCESVNQVEKTKGVRVLARGIKEEEGAFNAAVPVAFIVNAEDFLSNTKLSEEIFGPATLIVLCNDPEQLEQVLTELDGQLTATIHATEMDEKDLGRIVNVIEEKAGRIIYNGFPTGVEVCNAMQHGGPFPSTTDARSTSVGTAAIYRFLRPVAFQDMPDALLPDALKNANPLNIIRLVNGCWTNEPVQSNAVFSQS